MFQLIVVDLGKISGSSRVPGVKDSRIRVKKLQKQINKDKTLILGVTFL